MSKTFNALKPRATKLNQALVETKSGPHIPKHRPVVRSRANREFRQMCKEYGIA